MRKRPLQSSAGLSPALTDGQGARKGPGGGLQALPLLEEGDEEEGEEPDEGPTPQRPRREGVKAHART